MTGAGFEARPLSWQTGSEVSGIDLRRAHALTDSTVSALWHLLGERGILLFRDQPLDHEQHLAFTRRLGPLAKTGLLGKHAPPGYSDLFQVTNMKTDGVRSETENAAQQWHSDQAFLAVPARASLFRCVHAPQHGGDTMFANMYQAHDALSEGCGQHWRACAPSIRCLTAARWHCADGGRSARSRRVSWNGRAAAGTRCCAGTRPARAGHCSSTSR